MREKKSTTSDERKMCNSDDAAAVLVMITVSVGGGGAVDGDKHTLNSSKDRARYGEALHFSNGEGEGSRSR